MGNLYMGLKTMGMITKAIVSLAILQVFAAVFISDSNVIFASAVSGSDVKSSSAASTNQTAVNLKEGDWIYSTDLDKDNNIYASVTGYTGTALSVKIPSSFNGVTVKSVNREAFSNNRYITSVTVPEGVTDIGKYCFRGCIGLSSVTLPSTLKNICEGAFYECNSLKEIEIPDGVTKIGSYAFYNCWHIKSAKLSSSLKVIGNCAFSGCSMLESVEFKDNLESVGSMAFYGCTALKEVDLPSSLISLGTGAFINCTAMKSVSLGDGLTDLQSETFRGCKSLESVYLGKKLESVGNSAFEDCLSLKSVSLADSVKNIGMLAFYNCMMLENVSVGSSMENIGLGAFNGCTELSEISVSENNGKFSSKGGRVYSRDGVLLILCPQGAEGSVSIANGTEQIADYAFNGCDKVTELELPESLKQIGNGALMGCTDITVLSMPQNIEKIGCLAFGYYFSGQTLKKTTYLSVFGDSGSSTELYCVANGLRFTTYSETMYLNTDYVVLTDEDSFELKGEFLTERLNEISWESSDESIVKVNKNGKLTGVSNGSAVITASADGFTSRTVKITVIEPSDDLSDTETSYSTRNMYVGDSEELSSIFDLIINTLIDPYKFWYSSDPSVVIVNSEGRITATGTGVANIICHMSDGSENCCLVNVTERPTEFSLTQPENELNVGDSFSVVKSIVPAKSNEFITWKTDNQNVATVDDNGKVTGVGQGSCNITAVTADGLESSVTIKCVIPAKSISLNLEKRSVYQGKAFNLEASLLPVESQQSVKWSSSDPKVASVNSKGKVTGVSFGTATISAETASGAFASCEVSVIAKAETLSLDVKKLTMNVGTEHELNAIILPSYSPETTDTCTWSSTDESVAAVDENGTVTAVGIGNCIINCKIGSDLISKCQITVKVPALSVEITGEKNDIYVGEVLVLKSKIMPENATDTIEWFSDNEEIAYVTSKGSVKGVSIGTVTITVKATNEVSGESVTAEYKINVLSKAESIKLSRSSISLNVDATDSITYSLTPSDSNDTVRWYSTDESVAKVRGDGLITAVKSGSCYIYAETGSGCTARCKVTVN